MKKNILKTFAFFLIAFCCVGIAPTIVFADEVEPECTVVVEAGEFGDYTIDKESGNVGDIVSILPEAYPLFDIGSVKMNGTILSANTDGYYSFALVEGENKVVIDFVIANDKLAYIVNMVKSAEDGDWTSIFSVKNLLFLISVVLMIIFGSGFCATLVKSKKIKAETIQEVSDSVKAVCDNAVTQAVLEMLKNKFSTLFDKFDTSIDNIGTVCNTMARCMVLAQENTPSARLEIIKELSSLNEKNANLTDEVKKLIEEEVFKQESQRQEQINAINELEAQNNAILENKEIETVESSETEGRY